MAAVHSTALPISSYLPLGDLLIIRLRPRIDVSTSSHGFSTLQMVANFSTGDVLSNNSQESAEPLNLPFLEFSKAWPKKKT